MIHVKEFPLTVLQNERVVQLEAWQGGQCELAGRFSLEQTSQATHSAGEVTSGSGRRRTGTGKLLITRPLLG